MFSNGILLLTCPLTALVPRVVGSYLRAASELVNHVLYVQIDPALAHANSKNDNDGLRLETIQTSGDEDSLESLRRRLIRLIPSIYSTANSAAPKLDVRVLHPVAGQQKFRLLNAPDILIFNESLPLLVDSNVQKHESILKNYAVDKLGLTRLPGKVQLVRPKDVSQNGCGSEEDLLFLKQDEKSIKLYDHTCLGGTFDGIHNGHKVLLTECAIRARKKMTIGVTDHSMIQSKLLWELIAPTEDRISRVREQMSELDGGRLEFVVVPISDPFGPSIVDKDLGALVVSRETQRGGDKVNEKRVQNGLSKVDLVTIDLVANEDKESAAEEEKVSSSALRMRKLGTLLRPPKVDLNSGTRPKPYVIGLTGGVASGKSTIMQYLEANSYAVIHSDLLGHTSYSSPELPAYQEIVRTFGDQVLSSGPGSPINRKVLGQIVFADPSKLQKLNSIVWPAVRQLVKEEIEKCGREGRDLVFLESALLLEAGWETHTHEIWLVVISEKEAIQRMMSQRGLTEAEATLRLAAQMPNWKRVSHANVVLSSMWDVQFTRFQVSKALKGLHSRLNLPENTSIQF